MYRRVEGCHTCCNSLIPSRIVYQVPGTTPGTYYDYSRAPALTPDPLYCNCQLPAITARGDNYYCGWCCRTAAVRTAMSVCLCIKHVSNMYETHYSSGRQKKTLPAASFLSRPWLSGTQGEHVYTTRQIHAPAEVRGALWTF